jgi:hypothetical protein
MAYLLTDRALGAGAAILYQSTHICVEMADVMLS